jgi:hypothetical protein
MNPGVFFPDRQRGLIVHAILILVLALANVWGFVNASQVEVGPAFSFYLLITLVAFAPIPLLGYRGYALLRANYTLSRDNLGLHWGLRIEEIPLSDIEWIRPAADLTTPLRMPRLRLPGALLGMRRHPDLGVVEFLASEGRNLLLVATATQVFAISPADPAAFVRDFQHAVELGSLAPIPSRSLYPSFIIARAWGNSLVRYLWLSGLFLNVGLLIWVTLLIPALGRVPLGFDISGAALEPVVAVRLILLPLVSAFFYLAGWLAGLFFYQRSQQHVLAFAIWASSALSALLFLLAVLFLATAPV